MATGKTYCVQCEKEMIAYRCKGCSQEFCVIHLPDHHRELGLQLDGVEYECNFLRQAIIEQTKNPQIHALIQQINQWEEYSIDLIRRTAKEARQVLIKHGAENTDTIQVKLVELTEELKITRDKNDFNELRLDQFKRKLKELEEQLNKPSNISIRHDTSSFINRISVVISSCK